MPQYLGTPTTSNRIIKPSYQTVIETDIHAGISRTWAYDKCAEKQKQWTYSYFWAVTHPSINLSRHCLTILEISMQLYTCYSIGTLKSCKVQTRRFLHTKLGTHLHSGVTGLVTKFKENLSRGF